MSDRRCTAKGCGRTHYAKNYCKRHYTQVARHGKLTPAAERATRLKVSKN